MIRRLQQDLPELLSFFVFSRHLWRKLRTTYVIERCFVSASPHQAHGVLCESRKRRPYHLLHLRAIQPGMGKAAPST